MLKYINMFDVNSVKKYIYPVATMTGSIIGVGFFALPYVAFKVGIWLTLLYFLILATLVIIMHLIFGEISLKTPDLKRFPGFAEFHLGKWGKAVALLTTILGSVGVLLVYLLVGSGFLANALQPFFGGSQLIYTLIYFALASAIIFFGIKAVSRVELFTLILLVFSLILILVKGFAHIKLGNIFLDNNLLSLDWKTLFLPYGAIMFSLWGMSIIPETEEMLGKDKKKIKKVITTSILIAAIIYISFIFLILGITGSKTTESAFLGLREFLGDWVILIPLFVGVLTTFNAFITLGLTLKKVLNFDLGIKNRDAFIIACFTPLVLLLIGLKSFVPMISFIGGVLLGIDGILILLMYKKIGGKKILIYPLFLIFILGVIYELVYFIK